MNLRFAEQPEPKGIAQAFIIGREFIGESNVSLILGDNLFYGRMDFLRNALKRTQGATVFGYPVNDPERYGVVEFDKQGKALSIEEKPAKPKSKYAVPGLYCYDNSVVEVCSKLNPSARGELEITDVNIEYLKRGALHVELLGRGMAWLDTGTHRDLMAAGTFIETLELRQGLKIACPEEIAYSKGFIDARQLEKIAQPLLKSGYGTYLLNLLKEWPAV